MYIIQEVDLAINLQSSQSGKSISIRDALSFIAIFVKTYYTSIINMKSERSNAYVGNLGSNFPGGESEPGESS